MEDSFYSELLIELECPVCKEYMVPPIQQCIIGHSICRICRQKLPKCPLCQGKFIESRNISLEALARKMHYPCINKEQGCTEKLTLENLDGHEKLCTYKGFKCAAENCSWIGKLGELAAHWDSKKLATKPYQAFNVCSAKLKTNSYYANIIKAHSQLFWFKYKSTNDKIFWSVQFIGKPEEAKNYCYEIDIFKPNHLKRRILLCDFCQPINLENNALFTDSVSLFMSMNVINTFVADQLLSYNMRVHVANKMAASKNNPELVKKEKDFAQKKRDPVQGSMQNS